MQHITSLLQKKSLSFNGILMNAQQHRDKELNKTLDEVFKESHEETKHTFSSLQKIYNLPHIQSIENISAEGYEFFKKKLGFITLILYTSHGKVFFQSYGNSRSLPSTSISIKEGFLQAFSKAVHAISPKLAINDCIPIVLSDTTYCFGKNAHTIQGIVYAARIEDETLLEGLETGALLKLTNELLETLPMVKTEKDIMHYVYYTAFPNRQKPSDTGANNEIATAAITQRRYAIHRIFIKPFLKLLGISKNSDIKKRIVGQCENAQNLIDVACGDDPLVHILANTIPTAQIVVGNDVVRDPKQPDATQKTTASSQIQPGRSNPVVFTNHSATELPFANQFFDVAICKNTLHHMPTKEHLLNLLQTLKRIAQKVIIVEIENPQKTGKLSAFLNTYLYKGFLKDAGDSFLDKEQCNTVLSRVFSGLHIEKGVFKSKLGNYLWYSISNNPTLGLTT